MWSVKKTNHSNDTTREVCLGRDTREEAVEFASFLAKDEIRLVPNNPIIEQTGPDSISICIGVQKIYTYTLFEYVVGGSGREQYQMEMNEKTGY